MDAGEYFSLYLGLAQLDPDFEDFEFEVDQYQGESDEEAIDRYLEEKGIYEFDIRGTRSVNFEKAAAIHPTMAKVLKIREDAILQSALDEMMDAGILVTSIDEDGDPVYGLTEDYEEKVEEYNRKNEENN